jgi:purine-binding chemotaxis protein CheW
LSEEVRSKPNQPFKIGDLVRLNEELKQLRDALKTKKAERDKARREGKKLKVDLSPEIARLTQFLVDLEILSAKMKSSQSSGPPGRTSADNALNAALGQVKAEIENEKKKLEAESIARSEEQRRHEEELKLLRDELAKSKELAETEKESAQNLLKAELERQRISQIQPLPPQPVTPIAPPLLVAKTEENRLDIEDMRRSIETKVADEFSVIRSEVQMLREQILRQQDSLEARRRDLEEEKHRIEDQKHALESQVADQFSATRSELQRLREEVSKEQEELEAKRRELADEKRRIDEEKRILERRIDDSEAQRLRRLTRRAMEELQSERVELNVLKRSLQQLRSESTRDRKGLERDREAIRKARVSLEIERRKLDWRNALLQVKAKTEQVNKQSKLIPLKELPTKELETSVTPAKLEVGAEITPPPVDQAESGEAIVLGVRLGDGDYGIDISRVREIMTKRQITPLPRQPAYIEGVINIRGAVMPVINLRKRFDLAGEVPKNPNIVILESSQGAVAILVDSVSEVIRIPQDKIHPPPPIAHGMEGEYLKGICQVGSQLLLYLDVEKLLKKATPIPAIYSGTGFGTTTSPNLLRPEEQRVLKSIPAKGATKTQLMRRGRVSSKMFDKAISSLVRRGLITVNKIGNNKIITRSIRPTK